MPIKIVTDSTAYLTDSLLQELDITVISLIININGSSYAEVDIDQRQFYNLLAKSEQLPTSSGPSLQAFCQTFFNIVEDGNDIMGIFLSSQFSSTYHTALAARQMMLEKWPQARIEIIDSEAACMGYVVLAAARAAYQGQNYEDIIKITHEMMQKTRFLFVPDTLEYLKKGGRIGEARALLGSLLQIKPLLTLDGGIVSLLAKVRTKDKAVQKIIGILENDSMAKGLGEVTVGHVCSLEEAQQLADELQKKIGVLAAVKSIGPVIGMHVGPGTIGIGYYTLKL